MTVILQPLQNLYLIPWCITYVFSKHIRSIGIKTSIMDKINA